MITKSRSWLYVPLRQSALVQSAWAQSPAAGVRYLGWSSPAFLKKSPSCAIAQVSRGPARISPALQPKVLITINPAITSAPPPPSITSAAAAPIRSWVACWIPRASASAPLGSPWKGRRLRYATLARRYSTVTSPVPIARARGKFFVGSRTSAAAKVTLFQASLEKSEPTIAAPAATSTAAVHGVVPQKLEKFIAATSARR